MQNHGLGLDGFSEGGSEKQRKSKPHYFNIQCISIEYLFDAILGSTRADMPVKDFDPTRQGRGVRQIQGNFMMAKLDGQSV